MDQNRPVSQFTTNRFPPVEANINAKSGSSAHVEIPPRAVDQKVLVETLIVTFSAIAVVTILMFVARTSWVTGRPAFIVPEISVDFKAVGRALNQVSVSDCPAYNIELELVKRVVIPAGQPLEPVCILLFVHGLDLLARCLGDCLIGVPPHAYVDGSIVLFRSVS